MDRSIAARAWVGAVALLLAAGCAGTRQSEERVRHNEERIAQILSEPLDTEAYAESRRCLAPREYRDVEILDDQRIVFEGPGDQYWLNTLRVRCPDLRRGAVLRVQTVSALGRICDMDSFEAGDWFDWPWYQSLRWPWYGRSGIRCTLGRFQPVTAAQVEAIRSALRSR